MTQNSQDILNQIKQIAGQLEQQEALNAEQLQQGNEMSAEQQQQMANIEQTAAQKLGQIQQLIQQYEQMNQTVQNFQSQQGEANNQYTNSQDIYQPGFAGTNAEEVKQQNQQSSQKQNGRNTL